MASNLDQFFETQRRERQRELHLLEQTNLSVQLGSENHALTRMLNRRMETEDFDSSKLEQRSSNEEQDSTLDRFFEAQRAQRLTEVASIAETSAALLEGRSLLSQLFQRMSNLPRHLEQDEEDSENEDSEERNPTVRELQTIENAQRVSTLLSNSFRNSLEHALSRRPPTVAGRQVGYLTTATPHHPNLNTERTSHHVTRPRRPPSPPPEPVGWDSYTEQVQQDRLVRNERFDLFAEISGLIGDGIVTQALNSTLADVLDSHLRHRIESAPSVFTSAARERSMRTLNSLPRRPRTRNDFSDMGVIEVPVGNRRHFVPTARTRRPERRRTTLADSSDGDDRVARLESMVESLQNLLSRQASSQAQLESAVQQVLLNQTLLSTSATGINLTMKPETAGSCVVCLDDSRTVDSAFYRCGHVIACSPCAAVLLAVNPYCPLCRQKIDDVIKLYKLS